MWNKIKPRMKYWQFWLRVAVFPIMLIFTCIEYTGKKGYYYLDKLPRPPR